MLDAIRREKSNRAGQGRKWLSAASAEIQETCQNSAMSELTRGRLLAHEKIYEGRIVSLEVDQIEIGGRTYLREVVRHPGGVVILALAQDGRIPFVRQHRYPPEEVLLELPAGKLDRGEDPETSAARELEEETGLRPLRMQKVFSFYTSPGFCDELLHLYFAAEVETTQPNPEADESLTLEFYRFDEALALVNQGEIRDGKTILALLWYAGRTSGSYSAPSPRETHLR